MKHGDPLNFDKAHASNSEIAKRFQLNMQQVMKILRFYYDKYKITEPAKFQFLEHMNEKRYTYLDQSDQLIQRIVAMKFGDPAELD